MLGHIRAVHRLSVFENWFFVLNFVIMILFAGFEGDLETERKALLVVGNLNLALCHLKLQEYIEARDQCDKALKLNPTSEKGLFRRLVSKHNICACSEGVKIVLL
jgi:Tetratricopeptide repeat.